jgi:anti-sigma regulatory factor (Ser/Thr protein kinase)
MTLPSDPQQVASARTASEALAVQMGFAQCVAEQIGLALNEALANVIKHGYRGDTHQKIELLMHRVQQNGRCGMEIVIRDFGRQIDPAQIKSRDLADVRPGGIGVHIIRSVMDACEYRCCDDCGMELTMVKFLPSTA